MSEQNNVKEITEWLDNELEQAKKNIKQFRDFIHFSTWIAALMHVKVNSPLSGYAATPVDEKHWRELFKKDFYRDNNIISGKELEKAWKVAERHADMAYKYIANHIKSTTPTPVKGNIFNWVIENSKGKPVGEKYSFDEVCALFLKYPFLTPVKEDSDKELTLMCMELTNAFDDKEDGGLENLNKSTENLSKISDKDKWLREIRGEDETKQDTPVKELEGKKDEKQEFLLELGKILSVDGRVNIDKYTQVLELISTFFTLPNKSNEAIKFAEWIEKNEYVFFTDYWVKYKDHKRNNKYTTAELYNLFSPNEQGERKFTLDEMKDCFDAGYDYMVSLMPETIEEFGEKSVRSKSDYFKEEFKIDLGERK